MFCLYENNSFYLSRGDNWEFPVIINNNKNKLDFNRYTLTDDDVLYVAILEPNQSFENAIIRKILTNKSKHDEDGNVIFTLNSSDTEYLLTGMYYITIKLKQNNTVTTILPMKEFWITGTSKDVDCSCSE